MKKAVIPKINNIILVIGFAVQSLMLFYAADREMRFDMVDFGFWAWLSIPFLMLFFANRHLGKTIAARITLLIAVLIVAALGSFAIFDGFFIHSDAQSALVFIVIPFYGIGLSIIAILIATPLNFISKRKRK